MTLKSAIKILEKRKDNITKERDKLRELLDEIEMQHSNCNEALESLDDAIDKLSELV